MNVFRVCSRNHARGLTLRLQEISPEPGRHTFPGIYLHLQVVSLHSSYERERLQTQDRTFT